MSNLIGKPRICTSRLFQDVEQADLDQLVQLGNLVHGKYASVHPGDKPEMKRLLGGHAQAPRELGRVNLADDVGELGPRSEALGVTLLPRPPGDRHPVLGQAGKQIAAGPR